MRLQIRLARFDSGSRLQQLSDLYVKTPSQPLGVLLGGWLNVRARHWAIARLENGAGLFCLPNMVLLVTIATAATLPALVCRYAVA